MHRLRNGSTWHAGCKNNTAGDKRRAIHCAWIDRKCVPAFLFQNARVRACITLAINFTLAISNWEVSSSECRSCLVLPDSETLLSPAVCHQVFLLRLNPRAWLAQIHSADEPAEVSAGGDGRTAAAAAPLSPRRRGRVNSMVWFHDLTLMACLLCPCCAHVPAASIVYDPHSPWVISLSHHRECGRSG